MYTIFVCFFESVIIIIMQYFYSLYHLSVGKKKKIKIKIKIIILILISNRTLEHHLTLYKC